MNGFWSTLWQKNFWAALPFLGIRVKKIFVRTQHFVLLSETPSCNWHDGSLHKIDQYL